jgi:hypothetical protein
MNRAATVALRRVLQRHPTATKITVSRVIGALDDPDVEEETPDDEMVVVTEEPTVLPWVAFAVASAALVVAVSDHIRWRVRCGP